MKVFYLCVYLRAGDNLRSGLADFDCSKTDSSQLLETLQEFVSLPSISVIFFVFYFEVIKKKDVFASLLSDPEEYELISRAIIKYFESPIGSKVLLRDKAVKQWLLAGLECYKNDEFEKLNLLSIQALSSAVQTDEDVVYIINNSLFDAALQLIFSKFESSFQLLEQMIQK
ncbi:hypothetical protein RFI_05140, partial [Reticulomyxa filosa]